MLLNKIKNKLKFFLKKKKINTPERIFFENKFIDSLKESTIRNALFVGIGPYTYHYTQLFNKVNIDYHSLDKRPESMLWAFNKEKHKILDINKNLDNEYDFKFDLIVFMGMIGYGINNEEELLISIENLTNIINDDGSLLVAYESKFNIDVEKTIKQISGLELNDFLSFDKKTILDDDYYRFYFYKKQLL